MPAKEVRQSSDSSGSYEWAEEPKRPLKRYTVYVRFSYEDGPEVWSSIEEIDVNAENEADACAVAGVALARDYDDGGHILRADERIGWYM